MIWMERAIWYAYVGLLFAEIARSGGGTPLMYFMMLFGWPLAVPLGMLASKRGKKNDRTGR